MIELGSLDRAHARARWARMVTGSRSLATALGLLGLVAVGTAAAGLTLCTANWTRGAPWDVNNIVLMVAAWSGIALGYGVGLWWWWRAPGNPTGRLLYLAALCDCVYLVGRCWPRSAWATELEWSSVLVVPLLALVVLGWPTGRPNRRARLAVLASAFGVGIVELVVDVFSRSAVPVADWPDPPEARFTVPTVFHLLDPVQALFFQAFPAAIVIVVLVRRRQALPAAIRPLITPITVAGVLAAASLIVLHVGFQLFPDLLGLYDGLTTRALLVLLGDYLMIAFVAIGVLVAAARRRRAVAVSPRRIVVDLRSATPIVSPSAAVAATVGDPTARVRYVGPDGRWIDSTGALITETGDGRVLVPILDEDGQTTAALELQASTALPPLLADLALGTIAARDANERAAARAEARRVEVRTRSRELVAATDAGRRELERTLHDGAQQLLVGLALSAGLAARAGQSGASATLVAHIEQVRSHILELLDAAPPAALSAGLAAALRSLSATSPVPVVCAASGDLSYDDPLAQTIYLVAGEAVANAVKHARPTVVRLTLTVTECEAQLRVEDDGIGGLTVVPPSIAQRIAGFGEAEVERPRGAGSVVSVRLARPSQLRRGLA